MACVPVQAKGDEAASRLTREMTGFVASLSADQRESALYPFGDDERFDLRLAPLGLEGLRLDEMSDAQWAALESALSGVLSASGVVKMNRIRSLEREVAELEGGVFGFVFGWLRSARRYFLAVFGEPGTEAPFAMRFDGHHLSLNWTAVEGAPVSVTPLFLGGQPRRVPDGLERAGLRVLAEEEDRGIAFINALSNEERATARLPFAEGSSIRRPMSIAGEVPLRLDAPRGVMRSALDPESQQRLDAAIDVQLSNFIEPIAARYRGRIAAQSDSIRFAYARMDEPAASPLRAGASLYYRIQGSGFLMEYDNTSEEADHIHVVWRELDGDFGRDLLAEHREANHPDESGQEP